MSEVFDLDALEVEDEAAEPFTFTFQGERYEMPLVGQMDFADQLNLEESTLSQSLQIILGDEQFERLLDARIKTGRMRALIEAWNAHQGLEPGKSQASSRRSGNTDAKSRRTSRSKRK